MKKLLSLIKRSENYYRPNLDYPFVSKPRYSVKAPNKHLYDIISKQKITYLETIKEMHRYENNFKLINTQPIKNCTEPNWDNDWIPVVDGMVLYHFLVKNNPRRYIEVGSGNSTKFARKAIKDHALQTKIISIDPYPRADIDAICDQVIREKLENVNLSVFASLGNKDVLFIDNSHRMFMNSDATVTFLDILPMLANGVLVQFHDICLPYDYPEEWINRYYSEQYGLACYLLGQGKFLEIVFPCKFVVCDDELAPMLDDLCNMSGLATVQRNGCSFWLRKCSI